LEKCDMLVLALTDTSVRDAIKKLADDIQSFASAGGVVLVSHYGRGGGPHAWTHRFSPNRLFASPLQYDSDARIVASDHPVLSGFKDKVLRLSVGSYFVNYDEKIWRTLAVDAREERPVLLQTDHGAGCYLVYGGYCLSSEKPDRALLADNLVSLVADRLRTRRTGFTTRQGSNGKRSQDDLLGLQRRAERLEVEARRLRQRADSLEAEAKTLRKAIDLLRRAE
jgi:hypothetical protein